MFDLNSNVLVKTNVTAKQLNEALVQIRPDHLLAPSLDAIVAAEKKYGLSALFILAHACVETGYGHSTYAKTRNNLFGFNAVDSNPDLANRYNSQAQSVELYAAFLHENYLHDGGKYFNGATPSGIMTRYASAGDKAAKVIAEIMNMLANNIGMKGDRLPDGFPDKPKKDEQEQPTTEPEQPVTPEPAPDPEPEPAPEPAADPEPKPEPTPPKAKA